MISTLSKSALIQKKIDIQKFHRLSFSILVFCRREKLHAPSFSQQETRTRKSILQRISTLKFHIKNFKHHPFGNVSTHFDYFREVTGTQRHNSFLRFSTIMSGWMFLFCISSCLVTPVRTRHVAFVCFCLIKCLFLVCLRSLNNGRGQLLIFLVFVPHRK